MNKFVPTESMRDATVCAHQKHDTARLTYTSHVLNNNSWKYLSTQATPGAQFDPETFPTRWSRAILQTGKANTLHLYIFVCVYVIVSFSNGNRIVD